MTTNPTSDATAALAHRLRLAAMTPWDGVRCDLEAQTYIAEMTRRGWRPPRPTDAAAETWRRPRIEPEAAKSGAAACRAAMADAAREKADRDAEIAQLRQAHENNPEPEETA